MDFVSAFILLDKLLVLLLFHSLDVLSLFYFFIIVLVILLAYIVFYILNLFLQIYLAKANLWQLFNQVFLFFLTFPLFIIRLLIFWKDQSFAFVSIAFLSIVDNSSDEVVVRVKFFIFDLLLGSIEWWIYINSFKLIQ